MKAVMVKDPVCGMEVNEKTAKYEMKYEGKNIISVPQCAKKGLRGSSQTCKNGITIFIKMLSF